MFGFLEDAKRKADSALDAFQVLDMDSLRDDRPAYQSSTCSRALNPGAQAFDKLDTLGKRDLERMKSPGPTGLSPQVKARSIQEMALNDDEVSFWGLDDGTDKPPGGREKQSSATRKVEEKYMPEEYDPILADVRRQVVSMDIEKGNEVRETMQQQGVERQSSFLDSFMTTASLVGVFVNEQKERAAVAIQERIAARDGRRTDVDTSSPSRPVLSATRVAQEDVPLIHANDLLSSEERARLSAMSGTRRWSILKYCPICHCRTRKSILGLVIGVALVVLFLGALWYFFLGKELEREEAGPE